jgi:hypothetical protein
MSSRIARLLHNYERHASLPWPRALAGAQKVWFAVYDKADERRLRARLGEFELATKRTKHGWALCDLTDAFPAWMAAHEYRDSYFEAPELLEVALDDFRESVAMKVRAALWEADADTVVALLGAASLFGFIKISEVISMVQSEIPGRMLVFFPGEYDNNMYRLLDARDGWNYMAVPITGQEGVLAP